MLIAAMRPASIIEGSNERDTGIVQIKDLALGKELSAGITDNAGMARGTPGPEGSCPAPISLPR